MYIAYSNDNAAHSHHRSVPVFKKILTVATRVRKLFVILLFVVILGAVFSFGAMVQAYAGDANTSSVSKSGSKGTVSSLQVKEAQKVIVQRGDTLWSIASEHMVKGENIRSYIDKLFAKNHLQDSQLREGQLLLLP